MTNQTSPLVPTLVATVAALLRNTGDLDAGRLAEVIESITDVNTKSSQDALVEALGYLVPATLARQV
jgi:hypothetical protein